LLSLLGLVIWLFANININGSTLISYIANFINPFAKLMGLDGHILTAFVLALPANEIVLPIILMSYMQKGTLVDLESLSSIKDILIQNGWTLLTAINVMLFSLMHFPCATSLLTIKRETGSLKWTFIGFLIPTICGIICCMITTFLWQFVFLNVTGI
jgi:ferrous iron transport protein B